MKGALDWNSRRLTRSGNAAIAAFLHGLPESRRVLGQPLVAVGAPQLDINLCNLGSRQAADAVAEGCRRSGLAAFQCGLPGISDNLTQGIAGGSYSLPSREMIADGFAAMASAHCFDAMAGIHFCDKNLPGLAMALARNDFPGLILSGGSILPGSHRGRPTTILSAYDAQAAAQQGLLSREEAESIVRTACPGRGGCGLMATFNTLAVAGEAMGIVPPASASIPAEDPAKEGDFLRAGPLLRTLLERDIRPRGIIGRKSLENAMRTVAAIGGSTNAVLHLLAIAREAQTPFTLRDIQRIARDTPVLCDFAPRGPFNLVDLHRMGGTPVLFRHLIRHGILDGDCPTVTGATLAENCLQAPDLPPGQELVADPMHPFKAHADMQVCYGNLAPEGIVFKVSSLAGPEFHGEARCFDTPEAVVEASSTGRIGPGQVVVLRGQGPVGSPGMPELLVATSALSTPALEGRVALICDGRVSGVSHGAIGVHCSPEAAAGGPIGAVRDGDLVSFHLLEGTIRLHVEDRELARRRERLPSGGPLHPDPFLRRYASRVSQAHEGCVLV